MYMYIYTHTLICMCTCVCTLSILRTYSAHLQIIFACRHIFRTGEQTPVIDLHTQNCHCMTFKFLQSW